MAIPQQRNRAGKLVLRLQQRRLVAVLGHIDDFSKRLWLEALRQEVTCSPQVVWLSDGARGFWRLFDQRLAPYARGVLDFYHASQNLWQGVKHWLDGHTTRARRWFDDARHRLRHRQQHAVLKDIAAARDLTDLPQQARSSLTVTSRPIMVHRVAAKGGQSPHGQRRPPIGQSLPDEVPSSLFEIHREVEEAHNP